MVSCPVCHGEGATTGIDVETTRRFSVLKCRDCGLAFACPRPSQGDLDSFYTATYFSTPPEHINFFDARLLAYALKERGWKLVHLSAVHPRGADPQRADRAIEAIKRRRPLRAARYLAIPEAVERAGVAGYSRVSASPS